MISTQVNPATVGRHRLGGTSARFGFRAFCALFRRRTATIPAARSAETTAIFPAVGDFMPPLEDRIAMIEAFGGVHVTIDPHFVPGECGRCETEKPNVTCMRIYGDDPDPAIIAPLGVPDVCLSCGVGRNGAVAQALYEARTTDRDIRIEVCE